jgi:restriction endonuclease S subunit
VTRGELLNKPLPLPPIAEQQVIAGRVEALMKKCHALQIDMERSDLHIDQLLQAVLRGAFTPASTS